MPESILNEPKQATYFFILKNIKYAHYVARVSVPSITVSSARKAVFF
jgi:hypothetical protein